MKQKGILGPNGRMYPQSLVKMVVNDFNKNYATLTKRRGGMLNNTGKAILGNENKYTATVQRQQERVNVETYMEHLLLSAGYNLNDPNLKGTPARFANMFIHELTAGSREPEPKFTVFPNTKKYDELILLKDIKIVSTCAHHIMPFFGKCFIAYIPSPNGYICGISKLARVAHWFARRLQIQEELTQQIAEYLQKKLKPMGVAVVIEAQHTCMTNRGVMEPNSTMVTSKMLGVFRKKPEARAEFLTLIKG